MNLETLKKSHLKRNLIIGGIGVVVISAIILNFTRAKYKVTQSIPLVNGTINYSLADLNTVAIYINGDSGYTKTDIIPESGYELNEEESYCTVNNERDDNITLSYDIDTKTLNVTPMTTKGTKCYLYFDEQLTGGKQILAGKDVQVRNDFSITFGDETTGVVYQTTDWKGTSYYFAGAPTDNWVYFGGFYWRIIRVNGDGSVRLIYNGTSTSTVGTGTIINNGANQVFNSNYNRSEYVGLKYTLATQHGMDKESSILTVLNNWYQTSGLSSYTEIIDSNVGFCSDRNISSGYSWSSIDSTHFYATYERLSINKSPSLNCSNNDILQIPVGLITADEATFAGGLFAYGAANQSYYLYNGQFYWTMSPYFFDDISVNAAVFVILNNGNIDKYLVNSRRGMRPVINLKADTKFEGSGTSTDPFTVIE